MENINNINEWFKNYENLENRKKEHNFRELVYHFLKVTSYGENFEYHHYQFRYIWEIEELHRKDTSRLERLLANTNYLLCKTFETNRYYIASVLPKNTKEEIEKIKELLPKLGKTVVGAIICDLNSISNKPTENIEVFGIDTFQKIKPEFFAELKAKEKQRAIEGSSAWVDNNLPSRSTYYDNY
jgi:hypothetical protein